MRRWVLPFFLAVLAIAPFLYVVYYGKDTTSEATSPVLTTVEFVREHNPAQLEVGAEFNVLACKVIDGYRFGMFLEGNKWIEAHLPVATKDEATPVVIEWLNNTTTPVPTVKLLRKTGSFWIVSFRLMVSGKQEEITTLLKANDLLLE